MRLAVVVIAAAILVASPFEGQAQLRPSSPRPNCFSTLEQTTVFNYFGIKRQPTSRCRPAKGTPLPPGAGERDLPEDLASRLPPLPEGRRRVIVGNAVILLDSHTRAVLDTLPDVIGKETP